VWRIETHQPYGYFMENHYLHVFLIADAWWGLKLGFLSVMFSVAFFPLWDGMQNTMIDGVCLACYSLVVLDCPLPYFGV
jgi:hypothetical protein